jgi:phosphoribosylglycinamide formyltransferase-1
MNRPSRPGLPRFGVLGSGKGSNFRALAQAWRDGSLGAVPVLVLSDNPEAGILSLGAEFGLPARSVPPGPFRTRMAPEAEEEVVRLLRDAQADFVVLAGFLRVIKSPLLEAFPGRILNIHPSLLPSFRGLEAWRQALEAGTPETGCTVHLVDAGVDTGRILGQARVPVLPGDSAESLHARIQAAEHALYPRIVREFAAGL